MVLRGERQAPRLSGPLVGGVRRDMQGRGFALVNVAPPGGDGLALRLPRRRTVLPSDSPRWWQFPELARYACRLEALLARALPEEAVCLAEMEFRREPAGLVDEEVDRLHADGSYVRSVASLYGPGTVYRDGRTERSVPRGQTLLMTALSRARARGVPCTLHRRPGAGPERAVVVGSFEACRGGPRPAGVYRRVADGGAGAGLAS
jgi:hypothetical protein